MVSGGRMAASEVTAASEETAADVASAAIDETAAAEGIAPDPERVISDVETLKALSDPLRLRILETMISRKDAAWSVKELAAELDVPQTRLYHHVELLVERDLIRLAAQR